MKRARPLAVVVIASALSLSALWWLQHPPEVPAAGPAIVGALSSVAVPIATDDPASDDRDLHPILPILASRRVVALGEATHGTREFFRLKDRLLRLLVRRAGFTVFALEISPEAGERMNRYVRHGAGDVDDALRQFEFWTWKTEEVRELAQWMRSWNAGLPESRRVSFAGINAGGGDRDRRMAQNVRRTLDAAGPDGRLVVWAHNAHVSYAAGWMGGYLREQLGDSIYVVGFEFSEGSFRSRGVSGLRTHAVGAAGRAYYGFTLAQLRTPMAFVDFAGARRHAAVAEWLDTPRRSRDIDEFFYLTQFSERWHSRTEAWPRLYDGIVFVRSTTAARGLSGAAAQ